MKQVNNITEANELIQNESLVLVYIGQKNCSVCHSLKPQVVKVMEKFPRVKMIALDAQETPEVASQFQVLTVPVIMLFVEGKEYLRKARIVQMQAFESEVEKIINGYQKMQKIE